MGMHDNKQCKQKCECVLNSLRRITTLLEYPRSDVEQRVKFQLEIAIQDIEYLDREIESKEKH